MLAGAYISGWLESSGSTGIMAKTIKLLFYLIVLVVVGFLLWLIERFVPMDATIKRIIEIVIIAFLVIWLLNIFGILGALGAVKI